MFRILSIVCLVFMLIVPSCTSDEKTGQTTGAGSTEQAATTGESVTQQPGTNNDTPAQTDSGEQASMQAQEMLRSGDIEGTIRFLEDMSSSAPLPYSSIQILVTAHIQYALRVTDRKDLDEAVKQEYRYHHFKRVLDLFPNNPVARGEMTLVERWYSEHGLPLPESVDPMKFLPDENAETETAESTPPADEGTTESTEETPSEETEGEGESGE